VSQKGETMIQQRLFLIGPVCFTFALVAGAEVTFAGALGEQVTFYVARDGDDAWSGMLKAPDAGKSDGPFATLHRAQTAIRQLKKENRLVEGGAAVMVRGGTYGMDRTLEFTGEDSGTKDAPISYRAAPGESVRLLAGKLITDWQPVTDAYVLDKLDESARGQVKQADLRALGISDFGSPSGGGVELFFNGQTMMLSRWPNEGFASIVKVLGETERNVRGTKGCAEGIIEYEGDRPMRWSAERDAWVHGYWFWDWSEQRHKIKSIDTERRVIEVEPPYHG
jgi:hypothetical protein